jgi:hypothetical protein
VVRGSKKREKSSRRRNSFLETEAANKAKKQDQMNIFEEIFTEDDNLIWPLQLVSIYLYI